MKANGATVGELDIASGVDVIEVGVGMNDGGKRESVMGNDFGDALGFTARIDDYRGFGLRTCQHAAIALKRPCRKGLKQHHAITGNTSYRVRGRKPVALRGAGAS